MAKRMTKAEANAIGVLILVALPFVAIAALYQAIGPYAFFGGIALVVGCWVWYGAHQRKVRAAHLIALEAEQDAERQAREAARATRRTELLKKYGDEELVDRIMSGRIWQGQSAEQLRESIGEPLDVDEKVMKTKRREVWKYHALGGNRFGLRVTLNQSVVVGWDEKL